MVNPGLGWGFRILTDSVARRIRVVSGGFRAAPPGRVLRYFTICMSIESNSGRIRSRVGLGWNPGPGNPILPTQTMGQHEVNLHRSTLRSPTPLLFAARTLL